MAGVGVEDQRDGDDGPALEADHFLEVERGRVQSEAQFMFRLQTVGGFGGKSDQLNAYNTFLGDPGFFDRDLTRYRNVTTSSLRDATAGSLHHSRRIALSIVPRGRADLALPGSSAVDAR